VGRRHTAADLGGCTALDRMAVLETVRKAIAEDDADFLREGVRVLAQAVMEAPR
jgi:hypothetical protein